MRNNSDEAQLVQKELREGKTPRRTNTRAQHNRYHQEHKKTKTKTQNRQNQSPKPRSSPNVHPNPGANPGAPGCVQKPQNLIKPMLFQHFAPPNPGANPGASKTSRKAAHNKKPPSSLFLYSGKCSLIHHGNAKASAPSELFRRRSPGSCPKANSLLPPQVQTPCAELS